MRPLVRNVKVVNNYNYNYSYNHTNYGPKFENKEGIPRLFWFHKDMTLLDVYKHLITQFSFAQDDDASTHDAERYFTESFAKFLEYTESNEVVGEEGLDDLLDQDKTPFPFAVNIKNPYYDKHKSVFYIPKCRNCGEKTCQNCYLKASKKITLRQFIDQMTISDKFKDNTSLYQDEEAIKAIIEGIEKA